MLMPGNLPLERARIDLSHEELCSKRWITSFKEAQFFCSGIARRFQTGKLAVKEVSGET